MFAFFAFQRDQRPSTAYRAKRKSIGFVLGAASEFEFSHLSAAGQLQNFHEIVTTQVNSNPNEPRCDKTFTLQSHATD